MSEEDLQEYLALSMNEKLIARPHAARKVVLETAGRAVCQIKMLEGITEKQIGWRSCRPQAEGCIKECQRCGNALGPICNLCQLSSENVAADTSTRSDDASCFRQQWDIRARPSLPYHRWSSGVQGPSKAGKKLPHPSY